MNQLIMIFRKDEKPDTQEVICFINQEGDLYIGEKDDVMCSVIIPKEDIHTFLEYVKSQLDDE